MNIPFLFSSGIIVVILFVIGIVYTFREFSEMESHPSDFRQNKKEQPAEVSDEN
ncbi:hypothetical protein [Rhodohalobacter sp. 614A]|uniref:hypothetical protein n=1 Tax=Rhodohalobacter sp. 614A TaxID=2908649 RepID=UPI001F28392F|nr:hypothetical protein [Rhodohalobacter sp. 614A]